MSSNYQTDTTTIHQYWYNVDILCNLKSYARIITAVSNYKDSNNTQEAQLLLVDSWPYWL